MLNLKYSLYKNAFISIFFFMLNRSTILNINKDVSKWEGVIYPDIYI